MASILVVCTANVCRSPLAAALLEKHFADAGVAAQVTSAGFLTEGQSAHPDTVRAGLERGVDLAAHQSRRVDQGILAWEGRDAVITMTRKHLRELVVTEPSIWNHTVTLRELDRLIHAHGGRLAEMLAGRRPRDMVVDDQADDIADPIGSPIEQHRALAAELDRLTEEVVRWWIRTNGLTDSRRKASPIGE